MRNRVILGLVVGLGLMAQDKKKEEKPPASAEALAELQKASAQLAQAEQAMKDSALETQQKTIRFYQAVGEQERAAKIARDSCRGELVQENLVWKCKVEKKQ